MQNAKRTPPHTDGVVVMFVVIIILYKNAVVKYKFMKFYANRGYILKKSVNKAYKTATVPPQKPHKLKSKTTQNQQIKIQ